MKTLEYCNIKTMKFVDIADKYFSTVHKVRDTLDEIEDMFQKYPEVNINLYYNFEREVISVIMTFYYRFVEAFKNYEFEGMEIINDEFIETVIDKVQKLTS